MRQKKIYIPGKYNEALTTLHLYLYPYMHGGTPSPPKKNNNVRVYTHSEPLSIKKVLLLVTVSSPDCLCVLTSFEPDCI